MTDSRISGLHRLDVAGRIAKLTELGWLSAADAARLRHGRYLLPTAAADRMIENVVGVFGLPFAIAPNFVVDGRECVVPLVVEEPSIVAGLSAAARLARKTGGFALESGDALLIGQVHVTGVTDPDAAVEVLERAKPALLEAANAVHPRLAARGGGVCGLEVRRLELPGGRPLIVVHLLLDTCDAMGANLVNTVCEAIAPRIAAACKGRVALRILSNLADRSLVTARVRYRLPDEERDAIVTANDIAIVDPYRAATHNKGIMNGIDALAIATGNDWRAIEAGAHAYAARSGAYRALTRWSVAEGGELCGEITLPLKVGTVGGTLANNPAAAVGLALTGAKTAGELAGIMAAVGLAQNFAALRALVTSGIQAGHMKLHARSVAASVGAPDDLFDELVSVLRKNGDIKAWKAREILAGLENDKAGKWSPRATAAGKVILLGEHGVVYGRHALALPIPDAVSVALAGADRLRHSLPDAMLASIFAAFGVREPCVQIDVQSRLPRGKGLGSSAAIAVALARACADYYDRPHDDAAINDIAFACEKLAHGTPSGVDNTLSTYARPMLFRNDRGLQIETLELKSAPPLVVAWGDETGRTREQVARVRERYEQLPAHLDAVFDEMDALSLQGAGFLQAGEWTELGALMNICHGLLNGIGVSTPELEYMVALARQHGAVGAKLTGAGGGGAIVALCPGTEVEVRQALRAAGYRTLQLLAAED